MDPTLVEQIQAVMDNLRAAVEQAQHIRQAMRKQHLSFGFEFNHIDGDLEHLLNRLRYMQTLAARHEAAAAARTDPPSSSDSVPE